MGSGPSSPAAMDSGVLLVGGVVVLGLGGLLALDELLLLASSGSGSTSTLGATTEATTISGSVTIVTPGGR